MLVRKNLFFCHFKEQEATERRLCNRVCNHASATFVGFGFLDLQYSAALCWVYRMLVFPLLHLLIWWMYHEWISYKKGALRVLYCSDHVLAMTQYS